MTPRTQRGPAPGLALLLLPLLLGASAQARWLTQAAGQHGDTPPSVGKVLQAYMTNVQLTAAMKDFVERCGNIARMETIGYSVNGYPLNVLEISDKPGVDEPEPSFKYIANMHGTETGGRQLLLALAEWLCANHKTNATAARVVNNMHLWLMPTMNPDGFTVKSYENANGINLNRDFPDQFESKGGSLEATGREQKETKAVMDWSLRNQFIASANMHEGALVANYPYDGSASGAAVYTASDDDATFKFLAQTYARTNRPMFRSKEFPGGITNGADWYTIYGGMQDWAYLRTGCFEITLELWEQKGKAPLQLLWDNNRDSLLNYALTSTLGGLRGSAKRGATPMDARISVNGSQVLTRTNKRFGDFYRPLAPSRWPYSVKVWPAANPSDVKTFLVKVPADGRGVQLDVTFPAAPTPRAQPSR